MKLLHQSQRMFLRAAAPLFLLAGVAMYVALNYAYNDFAGEELSKVRTDIEAYVRLHDTLPVVFQGMNERLEATPAPGKALFPAVFSDTMVYNEQEMEYEPFRRLCFPVVVKDQVWQVAVMQSAPEHEDLAAAIAVLLTILFGVLFGVLLWVNRRVSRRIWQPFFNTLDKMRGFRLRDAAPLTLGETPVDEFRELHRTLEELTGKLQRDFNTVKQFTENASHELQTPLAVIQNKVEMLLQDEALTETQIQQINILGQSARRMARLNQSLLLLSKIENDQFSGREPLDLKPLVEKRLVWLEDFMAEKQLQVTSTLTSISLVINSFLADTLITNLLTNAVKYNLPGGILEVQLSEARLVVSNSGEAPNGPTEALTGRFERGTARTEGLGLGLSMVKEICEQNGFGFKINFEGGIWKTEVVFLP